MSTLTLKASLALWRRRLAYRQKKVDTVRGLAKKRQPGSRRAVVTRDEAARIKKWERLRNEASSMVDRRAKQLTERNTTLGDRALREARTLIGVMEIGGNNMGAQVLRIIRANGGTGPEPWCGDFVAWCYRAAGSRVVQRGWAAVRLLGFLTGMQKTSSPRAGDIVCFTFDHTGLFVRRINATTIECIEGNTGRSGAVSDSSTGGDGVYLKRRPTSLVSRYVRVTR